MYQLKFITYGDLQELLATELVDADELQRAVLRRHTLGQLVLDDGIIVAFLLYRYHLRTIEIVLGGAAQHSGPAVELLLGNLCDQLSPLRRLAIIGHFDIGNVVLLHALRQWGFCLLPEPGSDTITALYSVIPDFLESACPGCGGDGDVAGAPCTHCGGTGRAPALDDEVAESDPYGFRGDWWQDGSRVSRMDQDS